MSPNPRWTYLPSVALLSIAVSSAAAETVVEDFTTTDGLDAQRTTAWWDTALGRVTLGDLLPRFGTPFNSPGPDIVVSGDDNDVVTAFTITDLNGDGLLDAYYATRSAADYLFIGQQDVNLGGVLPRRLTQSSSDPYSVSVGDIDGDGDLDILVGYDDSFTSEPSFFYLNDGTPSIFGDPPEKLYFGELGDRYVDSELVDLNLDGRLDLLLASRTGDAVYYLNDGSPSPFQGASPQFVGQEDSEIRSLVAEDFNGDSLIDVLVQRSFEQVSRLYLNQGGSLPFSASAQGVVLEGYGTAETGPGSAVDVDNDGDIDLIAEGRIPNYTNVHINHGPVRLFDEPPVVFLASSWLLSGRAGIDYDADGWIDIVAGFDSSSLGMAVALNSGGTPPFSTATDFFSAIDLRTSSRFDFVDINGDTLPDASYSLNQVPYGLRLAINGQTENPYSSDMPPIAFGQPTGLTRSVSFFDVDNDGDQDVVAGNYGLNYLYLNEGPPYFVRGFAVTSDTDDTNAIGTVDLNSDGFSDLIAANEGINKWYPNDLGDGPFLRAASGIAIGSEAASSKAVAAGDLNGDGYIDLVFGNNGRNLVYYGEPGAEPFSSASMAVPVGPLTANTRDILIADLDADGDADIASANQGLNYWYANDGSANPFSIASEPLPLGPDAEDSHGIAIADLDRDGAADLVVANTGRNRWYRNTGNPGGFDPDVDGSFLGSESDDSRAVAVNPLVGGSGVEIVFANSQGASAKLYRVLRTTGHESVSGLALDEELLASTSLDAADVNSDGASDLVFGNVLAANRVVFNTPSGGSSPTPDTYNLFANRVQSMPLPISAETVFSAAILVVDERPPNTRIDYFLGTSDTGFLKATPGRILQFPVPGEALLWRANLSSLSPFATPAIEHMTILVNPPDADGDQLFDGADNCTLEANPNQVDSDEDGFGNPCDTDLNNDGITNFADVALFKQVFLSSATAVADFNVDGDVNFADLAIIKSRFLQPPGPAGDL